jgi:hypothetical protein
MLEVVSLATVISEKWLFKTLSSSDSRFACEPDDALGAYAEEGLFGNVGSRFSADSPKRISFGPSRGQVGVFCCEDASAKVSSGLCGCAFVSMLEESGVQESASTIELRNDDGSRDRDIWRL